MSNSTSFSLQTSDFTLPISSLPQKSLDFLWHPRIPLRKLTLLAADPGLGKTSLTLHLAASLSRGDALTQHNPPSPAPASPNLTTHPNFSNFSPSHQELAATLLLSPHDSPSDTLLPRLSTMHANLHHIRLLPLFHSLTPLKNTQHSVLSPQHSSPLEFLENACKSIPNLRLLVLDPITHFLGLTDIAHNPLCRSTLFALSQLADSLNIAILLTTRLAKKLPPASPHSLPHLHRALGSLAFTAAARSVLLLLPYTPPATHELAHAPLPTNAPLPEQPLSSFTVHRSSFPPPNRLLLHLKSNLTHPAPPLPLTVAHALTLHPELDPTNFSSQPLKPAGDLENCITHAIDFLHRYLADGPKSASSIFSAAENNGISSSSLRRAKARIDITARPARRTWFWSLKNDPRPIPTLDDELAKSLSALSALTPSLPNLLRGAIL